LSSSPPSLHLCPSPGSRQGSRPSLDGRQGQRQLETPAAPAQQRRVGIVPWLKDLQSAVFTKPSVEECACVFAWRVRIMRDVWLDPGVGWETFGTLVKNVRTKRAYDGGVQVCWTQHGLKRRNPLTLHACALSMSIGARRLRHVRRCLHLCKTSVRSERDRKCFLAIVTCGADATLACDP
jgi:hypothetical protein